MAVEEQGLRDREGIHLALGGGAARGLAHIGVLKVLQAHHIPIASICGTSVGALVGASFALFPSSDYVEKLFRDFVRGETFNRARYAFIRQATQKSGEQERKLSLKQFFKHGLLLGKTVAFGSMIPYEEFVADVAELLPDKRIEETKVPFFAVSVDLAARTEVVFNRGLIRSAVLASSAIPGIFPSIRAIDRIYVDGGWMNKVPVTPLKALGAEHVLAIDVADVPPPEINPRRGVSVMMRAYSAACYRLQQIQMEEASLVWRPPVQDLHWSEFTRTDDAIAIGAAYAEEHIAEVRQILSQSRKKGRWRRWLSRLSKSPNLEPRFGVPFELREIGEVESAEWR
jgi:NTE family protein